MLKVLREIHQLTEPSVRRRVYTAFSYPIAPVERILPYVPDHLRYIAEAEEQIFLSGPFIKDGQPIGEGMTILNTDSDVRAAAFMRADPLIRAGLRRFDLKLWELQQGQVSVTTRLSDGTFSFR
jgi:uncharacterized protein YciI